MNKDKEQEKDQKEEMSDIDFSSFILSMHAQTLINLGEIDSPLTGTKSVDLDAAKQGIDIIVLLRRKTHGNLSEAEDTLMENVLYDLRVKYIEKTSKKKD